jgi:hypothetical protein
MKTFPIILTIVLLTGCAGMGMQDTSGMSGGSGAANQNQDSHPQSGELLHSWGYPYNY